MAVASMRHMTYIGLSKDRDAVIDRLMKLGCVHITCDAEEIPDENGDILPAEETITEYSILLEKKRNVLKNAMSQLESFDMRKKPLFSSRRPVTTEEFYRIADNEQNIMERAEAVSSILAEISANEGTVSQLVNKIQFLKKWEKYPEKLSDNYTLKTRTAFYTASSSESFENFCNRMNDSGIPYGIYEVLREKENIAFSLTALKKDFQDIEMIISESDIISEDLHGYTDTASQSIADAEKQINELRAANEELHKKLKAYASYLPEFECLYDYFGTEAEKDKASVKLNNTKSTFSFDAWVPLKAERKVVKEMSQDYICHIDIRDPEENELPPTLLDNKGIGGFIEPVESMYSILHYGEVDPSTIASFFFCLFFGFMLSDAGYGILLTVGCILILKLFKLEKGFKKYISLFLVSGISTVFWGILFGSWFGNLIPTVTFNRFAIKPLWFDPTDTANMEHFMAFTLLLGVIHIFVAMGIDAFGMIKRGKWVDAICDVFFWYIFFIGEILFLLPYIPYYGKLPLCEKIHPYGVYLLIAGFVLILVTKGRKSKNPFVRMFGGITCLYSLVNMLSDALSYTRLMAMGLATGVIINVFNEIAGTAGGLASGAITFRFIFFVLIFIAANAFNFGINALSAYVNSCRLTYIEFFGKFYEGEGKEYLPLCQNTEYIYLDTEIDPLKADISE